MVDDDVVRVDMTLGELLDQPLCLVERKEFSDAHTYEGGLLLIDVGKIKNNLTASVRKKRLGVNEICKMMFTK